MGFLILLRSNQQSDLDMNWCQQTAGDKCHPGSQKRFEVPVLASPSLAPPRLGVSPLLHLALPDQRIDSGANRLPRRCYLAFLPN